jgi:hypothetical protein
MFISDWGYLAFAANEEQEAMLALSVDVKRPLIIQGSNKFNAPVVESLLYHFGALSTDVVVKGNLEYKIGWMTHTFPNLYDRYEEFFKFLEQIGCPYYAYFEYHSKNTVELEYLGAGHSPWKGTSDAIRDEAREAAQQKIYEIRSWTELDDLYIRPNPPFQSVFKKQLRHI